MRDYLRINKYLILIVFSCLFISVGYAAISAVSLNITGDALASAQTGVFISDAVCASGGNVLGTTQTTLNSSVTLANNDDSSTVTCSVTIFNNTNISYYYDDLVYDDTDPDFYSNTYIIPSVDVNHGDELTSQGSMVIHLTFAYNSGVTPSSSNNTLTSYISFRFVDTIQSSDTKFVDYIVSLLDGKTATNDVYDLGNGTGGCSYKLSYDDSTDANLRYVGSNPCNYVSLGGETWRIIGVMNGVGTNPLIKLINNDFYNDGNTAVLGKNNVNTWTDTTLYNSMSSLSIASNAMVESVGFFNGGPSANINTASSFYSSEKDTTTSSIKIGLMNVSDYGFATDNVITSRNTLLSTWGSATNLGNCVTNHNWLYFQGNTWTISKVDGRKTMFRINTAGNPYQTNTNQGGLIKTIIYLKNSVLYNSGDGTLGLPYTLR